MIISTELTEEELVKLRGDMETMKAEDLGAVMKAAIMAFKPSSGSVAQPVEADQQHG